MGTRFPGARCFWLFILIAIVLTCRAIAEVALPPDDNLDDSLSPPQSSDELALKLNSFQQPIGFSGVVTEGDSRSTSVEVPYTCASAKIYLHSMSDGGAFGRAALPYRVKVNGLDVVRYSGTSGTATLTVPAGALLQGTNAITIEFPPDTDAYTETTQVLEDAYLKIEEAVLPAGSFISRGQGPVVRTEGESFTFTVNSAFECAAATVRIHNTDRGGVGNGITAMRYVLKINGTSVGASTGTLSVPSGVIQPGDNTFTFEFRDDGDAKAESILVLDDSYIQVRQVTLPAGSFRSMGQAPIVKAEGESLAFVLNSPYECASATVKIHSTDRGGDGNGLDYLRYVLRINTVPIVTGTSGALTVPSGILQQGDNTLLFDFIDDGDVKNETTLVLEDSYIQLKPAALPAGSFLSRGQTSVVKAEGDTLSFTVNSAFDCASAKVLVHSTDRGNLENGQDYLPYVVKINGEPVAKGTSSAITIPSGVIQKGDNAFVFEFQSDGDSSADTTLVIEDSYIQLTEAALPYGSFKMRRQGPVVSGEGQTLTFAVKLSAPNSAGTIKVHTANRGGVGNGVTTLNYALKINGATAVQGAANSVLTIPAGFAAQGDNTFVIEFLNNGNTKAETLLVLEDSYLTMANELWPDADADTVPDYIEGDADPDGDTIPNRLDTDSDNDGFNDGDEYRSGFDPYDPSSIPVDTVILEDRISHSFWRDGKVDLILAAISFIVPPAKDMEKDLPVLVLTQTDVDPGSLGISATVESAGSAPKPLAAALLFDGSGSLDSTDPHDVRIDAGKAFVDRLGAGDQAAVLEFQRPGLGFHYTTLHQDFTSDNVALKAAMDLLSDTGGTPLYESVSESLTWFDAQKTTDVWQRVLVLFSDGQPNTDTHRDEAIQKAKDLRIPIVTVGLGPAAVPGSVAAEALHTLAGETRGLYVGTGTADGLANIYDSVAQGLAGAGYIVHLVFNPIPAPGTAITVTLHTNYGVRPYQFTVPPIPDTDGDGLLDSVEDANANGVVDTGETDPGNADSDGDGLTDGQEVSSGSNPLLGDSDGDGHSDGEEVDAGNDPNDDQDLPPNQTEKTIGLLTIRADVIASTGTNQWQASGHVTINGFLHFDGALTLDGAALTVGGSGKWFATHVPYVPGGELDIYQGNISIDASAAAVQGLNAAASLLEVVGLNVEIASFQFVAHGIQIGGKLELPEEIGGSVDVTTLQVTSTEGVEFAGQINLPDIKFASFPWGLEDAHIDLNTIEQEFGGGGTLTTPKFDVIIEQITIRQGRLETVLLGIGFPDPGINLDGSGVVWLQSVSGGLMDMAPGPPPLKIKASCELTIGPEVFGQRLITGVPELIYDTSGMFDATGTIYLFGGPNEGYEMAQIVAHFGMPSSGDPGFRFGATAYLWENVYEPGISFTLGFDNRFEATATGDISLSDTDCDLVNWIPYSVSLTTSLTNDGFKGSVGVESMEVTVTIKPGELPDIGANIDIGNPLDWFDFKRADTKAFAALYPGKAIQGTLDIPSNQRQVIVTVRTTDAAPEFDLIAPGTTRYTPGEADGVKYSYISNPSANLAFYILNYPESGAWKVEIANPAALGTVDVAVCHVDMPPTVSTVPSKKKTIGTDYVAIGFVASDPDGDASVSLYYDTDRLGFDGLTIVTGLTENDEYMEYIWDTRAVAPGTYYVYVKVDDGKNAPQCAYLDNPVLVSHATAVPAPANFLTTLNGADVTAQWTDGGGPNLASYRVHWREEGVANATASAEAVGKTTTHTRTFVTGRTYRMWVTAVDDTGVESAPSNEQVVTPVAAGSANNPPQIVSAPVTTGQAAMTYLYDVDAQDLDGNALTYALAAGPSGMIISAATGQISWQPAQDQQGTYHIAVTAADTHAAIDTQEFTLIVALPPAPDVDLDGLDTKAELRYGTDPALSDTDADGLTDGEEALVYHTDPAKADTDGDGVSDGQEVASGSDPLGTKGDIDRTGAVDAVDVQLVINAALSLSIAGLDADIDHNGSIDAVDVQLVINAALGL
ncbi:MAG: VWA domain-containing protein [Candidatus Hydrogenedentes bacterium]|nr:VWA domain-containing protein [Candidatus Hydrogenedentota bacterium]